MLAEHPANVTARLLEALEGLDLTSADGRAGINTLLSEIERACPGVLLQQAAGIDLRRLGWGKERPRRGPAGTDGVPAHLRAAVTDRPAT